MVADCIWMYCHFGVFGPSHANVLTGWRLGSTLNCGSPWWINLPAILVICWLCIHVLSWVCQLSGVCSPSLFNVPMGEMLDSTLPIGSLGQNCVPSVPMIGLCSGCKPEVLVFWGLWPQIFQCTHRRDAWQHSSHWVFMLEMFPGDPGKSSRVCKGFLALALSFWGL
jgi:hypothetical protein